MGEKEREIGREANTKTTIASVGISFYKVVFPVTVLSMVVNISSQSKHTSRGEGEVVSLSYTLYLITDSSYAAKAFCSSFHSLIFFSSVCLLFFTHSL